MPATGLTAARQADLLIDRMRGVDDRRGLDTSVNQVPALAEILPLPVPVVDLEADFALCRLDDKGRFHLAGLGQLLGWSPGDDLAVELADKWLVLRRTGERTASRGARFNSRDRVTLPAARTYPLRLGNGRQVLAVPLPSATALAVCNATVVFAAAPLHLDNLQETR